MTATDDELTESETKAKYGDSAYMDKTRKAAMAKQTIFYGIIERRVRGQDELIPILIKTRASRYSRELN